MIIPRFNLKYFNCHAFSMRLFSQSVQTILLAECLKTRSIIRVSGKGVDDYIQGLITNDVKHLKEGSDCMYTMFLNNKGRVLYDSIIYQTAEPKTFLIECDSTAVNDLGKHLLKYRVRRQITVDILEDMYSVWSLFNNCTLLDSYDKTSMLSIAGKLKSKLQDCLICNDPRIANLGLRVIAHKDVNFVKLLSEALNMQVVNTTFYKSLRYKLGVGEGVNELPPGNCFPLEANCDYLHGVSFHKGCYIGQELTARTYHTGVIRKRLMPLIFSESINFSENDIPLMATSHVERSIGKLRGAEGTVGIGLLRIHEALTSPELLIDGKPFQTKQPFWWPTEDQKRKNAV